MPPNPLHNPDPSSSSPSSPLESSTVEEVANSLNRTRLLAAAKGKGNTLPSTKDEDMEGDERHEESSFQNLLSDAEMQQGEDLFDEINFEPDTEEFAKAELQGLPKQNYRWPNTSEKSKSH
ncbi:hypothetical protein BG000_004383 [Podila horticola]|nr:hypothetical protein BG000_004383 [Podila horticola]